MSVMESIYKLLKDIRGEWINFSFIVSIFENENYATFSALKKGDTFEFYYKNDNGKKTISGHGIYIDLENFRNFYYSIPLKFTISLEEMYGQLTEILIKDVNVYIHKYGKTVKHAQIEDTALQITHGFSNHESFVIDFILCYKRNCIEEIFKMSHIYLQFSLIAKKENLYSYKKYVVIHINNTQDASLLSDDLISDSKSTCINFLKKRNVIIK